MKATKKERTDFDYSEYRAETLGFLDMLGNMGNCFDVYNPTRRVACSCMADLELTEEEAETTIDYLINFFKLSYDEQRSLILEWRRYSKTFRSFNNDPSLSPHQTFLLPGSASHRVCKNAIAKLVGRGKTAWASIGKVGKEKHGLAGRKANNKMKPEVEDKLNEFFFRLSQLGAPRATKLVTGLSADRLTVRTELKDADADIVELPACYRKRSLYRSFLQENDWEVSFDNKSRMTKEGTVPISWPSFVSFWRTNYPKIVISRPAEDICDECVIYANQHKYLQSKQQRGRLKKSSDDSSSSDEEEDEDEPVPLGDDKQEALRDQQEDLIVNAAKHVQMARAQRMLFVEKKQEARDHALQKKPRGQRTYTFVADFAQNMYIPNFAAEQPGATYYYSPLNIYPFGVVDTSADPSLLTAFVFNEGEFYCCLLFY